MKIVKKSCLPILVILVLAASGTALGQVDYSLRMRALGPVLSGILDDAITDAYRNPARIGGLTETQVYTGQFPGSSFYLPFPELQYYSYENVPIEEIDIRCCSDNYLPYITYTPLSFSFFTSLRRSMPMSVSIETVASGSERLDARAYLSPDGFPIFDDVMQENNAFTDHSSRSHLLADVAIAGSVPEADSRSAGARLTVRYDTYGNANGHTERDIFVDIDTPTEMEFKSYRQLSEKQYDELETTLKFGLFRPGSRIRELVAGAGYSRQNGVFRTVYTRIFDQDYDGNGLDPYGLRPAYTYERDLFDSNRDYRSVRVSGSVVLEWGDRVRSKHSASWSEGRGDGGALYRMDDEAYDGIMSNVLNETVDYEYDGNLRRYSFSSTIGLVEEVHDGVSVAVGVRAYFRDYNFDENADGTAGVSLSEVDTTYIVDTAYQQNVSYRSQFLSVDAPVSVEWTVTSFFAVRLGVFFAASRGDHKATRRQTADILGQALPFGELSRREERYITYSTGVGSVIGFEFNLKDKLIIDLYDNHAGDIGFTYLSARYLF